MIDFEPLARFGLLLVRPGMLVVVAPLFGGTFAPPLVKIGLTTLIALTLLPVVALPAPGNGVALSSLVVHEAAIGLAIGFALRALVAGAEFAGHLAGFQLGFTYAGLVDPQTGARNSVLSSLYGTLALLVAFLINAHHDFLRALALSYDAMPVSPGHVAASLGALVARTLGVVFVIGVRIAAPVVVVLLIVELALGLLSRAAPSLNIMVQGFSIRLIFGLLALAATLRVVPVVVRSAMPNVLQLAGELAAAFR